MPKESSISKTFIQSFSDPDSLAERQAHRQGTRKRIGTFGLWKENPTSKSGACDCHFTPTPARKDPEFLPRPVWAKIESARLQLESCRGDIQSSMLNLMFISTKNTFWHAGLKDITVTPSNLGVVPSNLGVVLFEPVQRFRVSASMGRRQETSMSRLRREYFLSPTLVDLGESISQEKHTDNPNFTH